MNPIINELFNYIVPMAYGLWRPFRSGRKGQTTVEYLLMLAVVVGVALIIGILFHKKLLGGMFTMLGLIVGKPSK
jgi:Flp pilus assembly pilin Flp